MMKLFKKCFFVFFTFSLFCVIPAFSQNSGAAAKSVSGNNYSGAQASGILADALNAYKKMDWKTSIFLFKKFHTVPGNITPESLYMLIMAQTYNSQYKQAVSDCDLFIRKFPYSQYIELVIYQKGKNLYHIGDYEKAVITLSDFCHTYPSHNLYASSLFWIAESFYATYNFDNAKPLYERIVAEYPEDSKAKDAKYRLDVIAQRTREEKLLFLLKQTGEDYLSSKESYEKALKQYQVESSVGINSQLRELRQQNENLDIDLANEKKRAALLEAQLKTYEQDVANSIQLLKEQADEALKLLDDE